MGYPDNIGYRHGRASMQTRHSKVSATALKEAGAKLERSIQQMRETSYQKSTAPVLYQQPVQQLQDERHHKGSFVPPTKYNKSSDMYKTLKRFAPASRKFLRLHPLLGRILDAWDIWKFFHNNDTRGQNFTPMVVNGGGWILQTDCGEVPTHIYATLGTFGPWASSVCFSFSAGSGARGINEPLLSGAGKFQTAKIVQHNPNRFAAAQYYYRGATSTTPTSGRPLYRQMQKELPLPFTNYANPDLLPIQQPMPWPLPLPFQKVTEPWPGGYRGGYGPGWPTTTRPNPPQVFKKPPKVTKEKKLKMSKGLGALVWAANGFTESVDLLQALYRALPKRLQKCRRMDLGCMSKTLWDNFDEMDWELAVVNVVLMNAEDFVWAKMGLPTKPMGRMYGSNMGANKLLNEVYGDQVHTFTSLFSGAVRDRYREVIENAVDWIAKSPPVDVRD